MRAKPQTEFLLYSFEGSLSEMKIYPVVMAKGVHLFPSRTQKLSPYTSKVLGWKRPGRIDSCRLAKEAVPYGTASFALSNRNLSGRGDSGRHGPPSASARVAQPAQRRRVAN